MKPQLLKVAPNPSHSFSVRRDSCPTNNRWHYHPELELVYIKKGSGTQFIGDNIREFNEGDVILVGPHLPHFWRFEQGSDSRSQSCYTDVIVAHFSEDFWGTRFLLLPENRSIKEVIEKAKRGILVDAQLSKKVGETLEKMLHEKGYKRLALLMEAIDCIGGYGNLNLLSSVGFNLEPITAEDGRINIIYEYSLKNYTKKIRLEDVANAANISVNSFCRYFKNRTNKTYSRFLIELKVGIACKLLIENKISIKQICYESGFSNTSCFHKYFKQITGKSPASYQKDFIAQ